MKLEVPNDDEFICRYYFITNTKGLFKKKFFLISICFGGFFVTFVVTGFPVKLGLLSPGREWQRLWTWPSGQRGALASTEDHRFESQRWQGIYFLF
jgi:hypothetical protein